MVYLLNEVIVPFDDRINHQCQTHLFLKLFTSFSLLDEVQVVLDVLDDGIDGHQLSTTSLKRIVHLENVIELPDCKVLFHIMPATSIIPRDIEYNSWIISSCLQDRPDVLPENRFKLVQLEQRNGFFWVDVVQLHLNK
jgi:hypothetical protein